MGEGRGEGGNLPPSNSQPVLCPRSPIIGRNRPSLLPLTVIGYLGHWRLAVLLHHVIDGLDHHILQSFVLIQGY